MAFGSLAFMHFTSLYSEVLSWEEWVRTGATGFISLDHSLSKVKFIETESRMVVSRMENGKMRS